MRIFVFASLRLPTRAATAFLLFAFATLASLRAAVPAFPGAEGFGANATGGRGGSVYIVTNLNDSGPGSFRDAVSQPNRYVVFAVGGIINVGARVIVRPNITIAGQTAPGEGITIYGNGVSFSNASNTITRYIRVRMGINGDNADAITIAEGNNMIFDHVSVSWGRDETFSISGNASNVTLQDCIIAQGLQNHSAGGLMQTDGGVSILRCLYINNHTRNPKVKGVNEFVNNVVYNWGGGGGYILGDSAGQSYVNVANNYFVSGPNTATQPFTRGNLNFHIYAAENWHDDNRNGVLDGAVIPSSGYTTVDFQAARYPYPTVATLLTPAQTVSHVLANAGASRARDRVDRLFIDQARSFGTLGQIPTNENDSPVNGPGPVAGGTAPVDTDLDGMPDWWELATGTNASVADHNGDINGDGYTNLEEYLNALAPAGVSGVTIGSISNDTGVSASDGITSDPTLVLQGTAAPGANVTLTRLGTGPLGTVVANGSGAWSFDYTGTALAEGSHPFVAVATTPAGTTPPTPAFLVQIDTTAPAAPAITSVVLSGGTLTLNGSAEPGTTVQVARVGNAGIVGTAVASATGVWSAEYTGAPLSPGAHSFTAAATDVAGNIGSSSAPYAVDTSIAPPAFTGITNDSGSSATDQITNDTTLLLQGSGLTGQQVSVTRTGVGVIGTATVDGSGTWSIDYTATTLPAGVHTFTATASTGGTSSPASAPLMVTVDTIAPAVTSIVRHNPASASTVANDVTYRVTFSEAVTGVDAGDFQTTVSGTTAAVAGITPLSPTSYVIQVNGITGQGTVRLDLKSSGTGIVDVAGNTAAGFTGGQSYTIRPPGSGVWITSDGDNLWSDPFNWEAGLVAHGVGAVGDFGTLDLTESVLIHLDSPRTVGSLIFSDTATASAANWTIDNQGNSGNTLTLDATSGAPTITVNALGTSSTATVAAALTGSEGLTKNGNGTLVLATPNPITGSLNVARGILRLASGSSLAPATTSIGTADTSVNQLEVAGGTFSTTGTTMLFNGGGSGIVVSAGSASFETITNNNKRDTRILVTGGAFSAQTILIPRSNDNNANFNNQGFIVRGGSATVAGSIGVGTADSYGTMAIEGGTTSVGGPIFVGWQATSTRGGRLRVTGGEFTVLDATDGIVLTRNPGTQTNQRGWLDILGGVTTAGKITFGYDTTASQGTGFLTLNGGTLYVGAGGLERRGSGTFAAVIDLINGTLGASADWSSALNLNLPSGNTVALKAADAAGLPRNIALSGVLAGAGGFTKTGGGVLTLSGATTFTGPIDVIAGTLRVASGGSLAAGAPVTLTGGTLAGAGTMNRSVTLNGATLAPDGTTSLAINGPTLTWNSGGRLAVTLGANGVSGNLVLTGALQKGTTGSYEIAVAPAAGFAPGNTYTLATFASTNFVAGDFVATGLPSGYVAYFNVTNTALQVTIKGPATIALGGLRQAYDGTPRPVTTTTTPGGLNVVLTYAGGSTPPTLPGSYSVAAVIDSSTHVGSATGTLIVTTTALVRHAPVMNGDIDGSVQMLLGESTALNSNAGITGDLLVPGTPTVQLNGSPTYGGTFDAAGATTPSGYSITLNHRALLRHVVRRIDPLPMPVVAAPLPPAGSRDVAINNATQTIGDFATLRNLTLNSNAGVRAIPPGVYGTFTANRGSGFSLGIAGATLPAVYHLQGLSLNSGTTVEIVGPVVLRVGGSVVVNGGTVGAAANPGWLLIELANGGLTMNSGATVRGEVLAPNGSVILNSNATLRGRVSSDRLILNSNALLDEALP